MLKLEARGAGTGPLCWSWRERGRYWDPEKGAISAGSERPDLLAKGVSVRGNITGMRMKENCHNIVINYALQPGTHVPGHYTSLPSPC